MSAQLEFNLINGTFDAKEAKNLMTDLYASKIKYHSLSAWRYEESTGKKSEYHENKIKELKKERDRFLNEMNSVDENQSITIESKVMISK
jgi:hypothetical protein